jgi:hypothetical protein
MPAPHLGGHMAHGPYRIGDKRQQIDTARGLFRYRAPVPCD